MTALPLLSLLAATYPDGGELRKRATTGGQFTPEARIVSIEDRTIDVGRCTYHLQEGQALPVRAGKGEFSEVVGFVYQGTGTVTVHMDERADAWAFANHMVMRGDHDVELMRDIAHQTADYTVPIHRGVLLSTHPEVLDLLLPPPAPGEERDYDAPRNYDMQMVVEDQRGVTTGFIAAGSTLPNRISMLVAGGLDIRPRMAFEMMADDWGGLPLDDRLRIGDFITDDHYNVARGPTSAAVGPQDKWLTCFQDSAGVMGLGEHSTVFSHGRDPDQNYHRVRFTGEGFPEEMRRDPMTPGLKMRDVEPVDATVRVEVRPIRMRKYMRANVRSRITVRATRDGVQAIVLSMPRYEARNNTFELQRVSSPDGESMPWTVLNGDLFRNNNSNDSAALVDLGSETDLGTVDGAPADALGGGGQATGGLGQDTTTQETGLGLTSNGDVPAGATQIDELTPDRTDADFLVMVLLPEPLEEGEEVSLYLLWKAEWNFAQIQNAGGQYVSGGPTTGFRNLLPELYPTAGGTKWSHETTVTMPDIYNFSLVVSGETLREVYDDEAGIVTIKTRDDEALRPGLAVGKWIMHEEAAAFGFPNIRVHLNPVEEYALEEFGPELRRVLGFYNRLMPELELDEFEIYQGKDMVGRSRSEPGDGLLEINQVRTQGGPGNIERTTLASLDPYMSQTLLAREVGRRYWDGHVQPGGERESWIRTVLPEVYAAFYVRGVHGTEAYFNWMEDVRSVLESPQDQTDRLGMPNQLNPALNLGDTGSIRGYGAETQRYYGLYVMGNMMRYKVGENLYYRALDRVLILRGGNYVTSAMLEESLENYSGQELDEFFDFWVHGGIIPSVEVDVHVDETGLTRGCIYSNVPFGSFDVPIAVTDMDEFRSVSALVDVDDGRGWFEVPAREDEVIVQVDPDGLILLQKRKVRMVDSVDACFAERPPPAPEVPLDEGEPAEPTYDVAPEQPGDAPEGAQALPGTEAPDAQDAGETESSETAAPETDAPTE